MFGGGRLLHLAVNSSRPLLLILFTVFLDVVGLGVVIPVAPFYATSFGATPLQVGLLFTAFAAAQFLATPVLGAWSDRFGRRPILLLSLAGETAGYLIMGLAPNLGVLYLARVVSGATAGNIGAATAYLADISKPEARTRTFSLFGAAFGVGFLFGPAMGGALSALDIRAPALAAAGLVCLNMLFAALWLPESLPVARRSSEPVRSAANPLRLLLALVDRPILRRPLLATFLVNFAFSGMQTNLAVYLSERFSFGPAEVAALFVAMAVVGILSQALLVGRLSARFSDVWLLVLGFGLTVLAYLGIGLAPIPMALWPVVVVQSLGSAFWRPALASLVSKLVSPREQGLVNGGAQSITSLASVLGPIGAGVAYEHLGIASPYWLGATATGLAALVMLGVSVRQPQGQARLEPLEQVALG
jgi:MFS transporter, DHA1 family, tetracycline resistance protein